MSSAEHEAAPKPISLVVGALSAAPQPVQDYFRPVPAEPLVDNAPAAAAALPVDAATSGSAPAAAPLINPEAPEPSSEPASPVDEFVPASGGSALERRLAQRRIENLKAPAAPRTVPLIDRLQSEPVRRQLEGLSEGQQEGLAALLRGVGDTDLREIVLALYVSCSATQGPCTVQNTILLARAQADLLEWALESEYAKGAQVALSAEERTPIDVRGGEGWHLTRIRLARSEERLP